MTSVICENGDEYKFEVAQSGYAARVTKSGKVRLEYPSGVRATFEFPTPAVRIKDGER